MTHMLKFDMTLKNWGQGHTKHLTKKQYYTMFEDMRAKAS